MLGVMLKRMCMQGSAGESACMLEQRLWEQFYRLFSLLSFFWEYSSTEPCTLSTHSVSHFTAVCDFTLNPHSARRSIPLTAYRLASPGRWPTSSGTCSSNLYYSTLSWTLGDFIHSRHFLCFAVCDAIPLYTIPIMPFNDLYSASRTLRLAGATRRPKVAHCVTITNLRTAFPLTALIDGWSPTTACDT